MKWGGFLVEQGGLHEMGRITFQVKLNIKG